MTQSDGSHARSRSEQQGVASIIPPKRLLPAWTGHGEATSRVKGCTVEEDLGEGAVEGVQSGSTHRKVGKGV